ncbi:MULTISPECIES: HTH-type transcriptional regulator RutR [Tenebrionibacter/Tenebrionicola group]|jgi:TetR/AcrR family transcriptional regulator|uniref:HTH-type transcriptional regulator RutR n=2 Tax=Tenebrionibacter/Tenebrionicola group TaxID=2969848 RepID=A0A8K0XYH5_9ENTR|nr:MULTISPECIES: HTH-type transcriptional regulator RutR [Tenebrionibacter/Tenebrionicola group]MBK4716673.1 HTH-type transcriptional regulator RutR [Tenebrionibacter intestinalis]MBV4412143.1 HTH-type transcriptional regulator RutR [Tenebrionicola larvae]MBV5097276.1 HTH-type transcriptional regulator RutR [Tenebrionicola larvae]
MADSAMAAGRRATATAAKKTAILRAGLDIFSRFGLHGATLDRLAGQAGVSKTNLLYYFPTKETLYIAVLQDLLDIWLAPLKAFRADSQPVAAISDYIRLKLAVSRDYPQASRLFCQEMLQGAPLLKSLLEGELKELVAEKTAIINDWIAGGRLAAVDAHHLIFTIWATTQHYADFSVQIEAVSGRTLQDDAFFHQAVEHIQRIILKGVCPR